MSPFQTAFCRSAPWRLFARRVVLRWALQGQRPHGRVLEIGAGTLWSAVSSRPTAAGEGYVSDSARIVLDGLHEQRSGGGVESEHGRNCGIAQLRRAAASLVSLSRSGLALRTAAPPSDVRQRTTTDIVPRGISDPSSIRHRSATSANAAGTASSHGRASSPNRTVSRRRTPSSSWGTRRLSTPRATEWRRLGLPAGPCERPRRTAARR
jgi:hypothetical protein